MIENEVIIIGAGIGGLVTALQLHRIGVRVQVFESVDEIKALGVGINLLPHAVRVLTNLGLERDLDEEGVRTAELLYFNKYGQRIWQEARGIDAGYKWPQFSIHRGRLQAILLRAVRERLGEDVVKTGHHLASLEAHEDGVTAHFIHRKTGKELGSHTAGMLIGADGIHSVVRAHFYPNEGAPKYGGRVLWRASTRSQTFLTGRSMIMAGYTDRKFVAYPISLPDEDGLAIINWIAELTVPRDLASKSDWNRLARKEDFAPFFADWRFDWLDVPRLIEDAQEVYEFPLVDRDPLLQWTFGAVTLLGDAAHPMYPIGSNGASQAILDSDALREAIENRPTVTEALAEYEQLRREKTSSIILSNRQNGPEAVMQIVEDRAPHGFTDLNEVIRHQELMEIAQKYKQVAGFEKEALNSTYQRD